MKHLNITQKGTNNMFFKEFVTLIEESENILKNFANILPTKSISNIFDKLNKVQEDLIDNYILLNNPKSKKSKIIKISIKTKNRESTKDYIANKLSKNKLVINLDSNANLSGSSFPGIKFNIKNFDKEIVLLFKPASGGMSDTTINSTITELVPLILLYNKATKSVNEKKTLALVQKTIPQFSKILSKKLIFVNKGDMEAGTKMMQRLVDEYDSNDLFKVKLQNAIGIYKYLLDEGGSDTLVKYFWGYRAKPTTSNGLTTNVPKNHKGDIFIQYYDGGNVVGVSLKAGGAKTKEPQLNTYIGKVFDYFGGQKEYKKLIGADAKTISSITGTTDIYVDKNKIPVTIKKEYKQMIGGYELTNLIDYENKYDSLLNKTRTAIINLFNGADLKTFKKWINEVVIGTSSDVPLVVVKGVGSNYEINSNNGTLNTILPKINKITAKKGSGKQEFSITLSSKKENIEMSMSVRTNKAGIDHKLNQIPNLAFKYNGLK